MLLACPISTGGTGDLIMAPLTVQDLRAGLSLTAKSESPGQGGVGSGSESAAWRIRHITREGKRAGEPDGVVPHVRFEVAGGGDGAYAIGRPPRHSSTLPTC
jgi:hypothetical protein